MLSARFPGKCSECRKSIAAGDPIHWDRATKKTLCVDCAPPDVRSTAPAVVHVALSGKGEVTFRAAGRLNDEHFGALRKATTGGRFKDGVNFVPMARAAVAIAELGAAGVCLVVEPDVRAALDAVEQAAAAAVLGAEQRTADVDAILAARGGALDTTRAAAPAIDWAALEREAAQALRDAAAAQEEAAKAKDEHERKLAQRRAEQAKSEARRRVRASAARRLQEAESDVDAPRRGPANDVERWALSGLQQLAANDPDRAQEKNEIGFNASDGGIGHALAWLDDLTDQEWRLAVQIARHYPRQIGQAPGAAA